MLLITLSLILATRVVSFGHVRLRIHGARWRVSALATTPLYIRLIVVPPERFGGFSKYLLLHPAGCYPHSQSDLWKTWSLTAHLLPAECCKCYEEASKPQEDSATWKTRTFVVVGLLSAWLKSHFIESLMRLREQCHMTMTGKISMLRLFADSVDSWGDALYIIR